MRPRLLAGVVTFVAALSSALPALAQVETADAPHAPAFAEQVEQRPAIANFEGRKIDLARGWRGATACVVWRQQGILDCFRTRAEGKALVDQLNAGRAPAAANGGDEAYGYQCGGPLELYRNTWWGGQAIWFYDEGYWQNLGDYGFDNATSSYAVGPCYAHLAENNWGGGWWYPGDTSPYGSAAWMSSGWDNRVSSIFIE